MNKKLTFFVVAVLLAVLCLQIVSLAKINNYCRIIDNSLAGFSQRVEVFSFKQNELIAKVEEMNK